MNLTYSRDGNDYVLSPKCDEKTLETTIGLMAEAYGVQPASVTYLLQYGLRQSLQDSAAQPSAAAKAEENATPESVAAAIKGAMDKRFDAIVAGTVAVRGFGESREPLRAIALEIIRAAAKSKGKKLGSDKEAIDKLVTAFIEKNRDKLQAEYDRRKSIGNDIEL